MMDAPERIGRYAYSDINICYAELPAFISGATEYVRSDIHDALKTERDTLLERLTAAERERDALMSDKDRLDFLDQCNANLNAHYGTKYKWEMVLNHNVNRLMTNHLDVDLNDSKAHGFHSCREAIDREIMRVTASRKARATLTSKEPE